jgi:MFS family permease
MGGAEVARRLGAKDLRWWLWVPAISFMIGAPVAMIGLFFTSLPLSIFCIFVTFMTMSTFTGVLFATVGTITSPGMRGVASSSLLMVQMILGLGLGPLFTGWMSDELTVRFGQEGLRYALFVPAIALVWGSIHYFLAAKTIRYDAGKALDDLALADAP